jgi:acyl-CoA thioesterase I
MRNERKPRQVGANRHAGLRQRAALAFASVLWVISSGPSRDAAAASGQVILVLGDSFTAGLGVPRNAAFPAQLEARLRAQGETVRIVNAGISGDTTAGGVARVDRAVAEKPDLVILELGANDALRGVQPAEVRDNLTAMIIKIRASGVRLLLTGMRAPSNWGEEYRTAFDRVYPDLARTEHVPLYPFFLQGVAQDPRLNQRDGLHPNERGVAVLAERLAPVVKHLLRDQITGEIPVAAAEGIVPMDDWQYQDYTRHIGNLPDLSKSYIFGTTIPVPSTDHLGHIQVLGGRDWATDPESPAHPPSIPADNSQPR